MNRVSGQRSSNCLVFFLYCGLMWANALLAWLLYFKWPLGKSAHHHLGRMVNNFSYTSMQLASRGQQQGAASGTYI